MGINLFPAVKLDYRFNLIILRWLVSWFVAGLPHDLCGYTQVILLYSVD